MRGAKTLWYAALVGDRAPCSPPGLRPPTAATNHVRDVQVHPGEGPRGGTEIEIVGTGAPSYNVRVADGGRRLLVDLSNSDVAGAPAAITTPIGVVGGVLTQGFDTERRAHDPPRRQPAARGHLPAGPAGHHAARRAHAERGLREDDGGAPGAPPPAAATPRPRWSRTCASSAPARAPPAAHRTAATASSSTSAACPPYSLAPGRRRQPAARAQEDRAARDAGPHARRRALRRRPQGISHPSTRRAARRRSSSTAPRRRAGHRLGRGRHPRLVLPGPQDATVSPRPSRRCTSTAARSASTAARRARSSPSPASPSPRACRASRRRSTTRTSPRSRPRAAARPASRRPRAAPSLAQQRYNGRRINIDLKDADIHNILRLLADTGPRQHRHRRRRERHDHHPHAQRAVGPGARRRAAGQGPGHGAARETSSASPRSPSSRRSASSSSPQQKQEYELTPLETRLIPVSYAQADEIQARAKDLLSPRGSIAVDERTNVLIARDTAGEPQLHRGAHSLARHADRAGAHRGAHRRGDEQLQPRRRHPVGRRRHLPAPPRATRRASRSRRASASPAATTTTTRRRPVCRRSRATSRPQLRRQPARGGRHRGRRRARRHARLASTTTSTWACACRPLETTGLVRIVSAPRVMVLDNREARINQGTLIPYAQVSALGVQTTFQEAKLQLLVKPHVTADGSVAMHVKLNRDEPNFNQTAPAATPTILKREAETDLLVMDGHTAVIGGIYTRNTGRNLEPDPVLRRHPHPRHPLPAPQRRPTRATSSSSSSRRTS